MTNLLRFLVIFAHPDDQSMRISGMLANMLQNVVRHTITALFGGRAPEKELFEGVRQENYVS
jgi:LmbE family N-acetylglucosaminyl deacetylase